MFMRINFWLKRLIKEWLFFSSALGLLSTSIYLKKIPDYTPSDFRILTIISLFLIVLKGLENSNFLYRLASLLSKGKYVSVKLVLFVAFLSMFITNDIALLVVVPMTIIIDIEHKDVIVILEALAANACSALLPSGNPQNMFIYWHYNLNLLEFVKEIYPFTLISMLFILLFSIFFSSLYTKQMHLKNIKTNYKVYLLLLALILGILLKIFPIYIGVFIVAYALFFDRDSFKIDYLLIGMFFMFFGFTDNMKNIVHISINSANSIFLASAFLSQVISNVPASLMLSDFTNNWRELLWGVSTGGYGNLIGSLANLIAYRIYVSYSKDSKWFLIKFMVIGYLFFSLTIFIKIYLLSIF